MLRCRLFVVWHQSFASACQRFHGVENISVSDCCLALGVPAFSYDVEEAGFAIGAASLFSDNSLTALVNSAASFRTLAELSTAFIAMSFSTVCTLSSVFFFLASYSSFSFFISSDELCSASCWRFLALNSLTFRKLGFAWLISLGGYYFR
jgi:hypothetical protein